MRELIRKSGNTAMYENTDGTRDVEVHASDGRLHTTVHYDTNRNCTGNTYHLGNKK